MKKLLLILTAVLLPLPVLAGYFPDVPDDHQYAVAINHLKSVGVIDGHPDGTYRPDDRIDRAAFSKIVLNSTDIDFSNYTPTDCFSDVKTTDWFAKYVCIAKNYNIIKGYNDGKFRPGNNINVAESLKIVIEAFDETNPDIETDPWYNKYISLAQMDNFYLDSWTSPFQEITRGEMAQMIYLHHNNQ